MADIKKKKKSIKKKYFRYLVYGLFLSSLVTLGILIFLDVIPGAFFLGIAVLFLGYDFLVAILVLGKGWKKRMLGTFLAILKILLVLVFCFYLFVTMDFLNKINRSDNYNTKNYSLLVLNTTRFEKLKDLKEKKVGFVLGSDGILEAKKYLDKKIEVSYFEGEELTDLLELLVKEEIEAILVENALKSVVMEEQSEQVFKFKSIYDFSVDIPIQDQLVKNVDVTKESFNMFISGIDSYGKISSVSRSDVNMVVTINPLTHKILFTSIPRDYYVKLNGIDTTFKDKLTHAGIYGIDKSVKTVEDLLGIDIHYYAKVNFTSLVDLVDKIGGIDVSLDKSFRAYYVEDKVIDYTFLEGVNHLNGEQALAFSRERKSLPLGDVERAEHQQMVLEAILNKVLQKSIITKYNDILNALENKFVTNIGTKNMTKLVKMQLKKNEAWQVYKNTLRGTDSYQYTYSYKRAKSYVMNPDEASLKDAKEKIQSIFNEE